MDDLQYNGMGRIKILYLYSFKPRYKWMTFNTVSDIFRKGVFDLVLNLVING